MSRSTRLTLPLVTVGLVLSLAASPSATGDPGPDDRTAQRTAERTAAREMHQADLRGSVVPTAPFLGIDGLLYDLAPFIVSGNAGVLYVGQDFDTACENGDDFERGLDRLSRLAKVIEQSGRRVVFTVAPNKASVVPQDVPDDVPHGDCTLEGLADQDQVLDTYADRNFLRVRRNLQQSSVPSYWRTDAHWSTVGASIYAQRLARKLDPRLARQQRYVDGSRTELGDLLIYLLTPIPETAPSRLPDNGVRVKTAPDSVGGFDPTNEVSFDHSWNALPARKTLPGRTLLVGDSFTYVGLEPLRNLFRHGRFLWIQDQTLGSIVQGMKTADTVVIEVVQRFVARSALGKASFRRQVARALRNYDARHR